MAPLVEVRNLSKHFSIGGGWLRGEPGILKAVDDVSFYISEGETLGLVGESGCGKTTLGRTLLRLYEPTSGQAFFDGVPIFEQNRKQMLSLRRKMQIVFQDPYASLDPRMTVAEIIAEGISIHKLASSSKERMEIVHHLLDTVGLRPDASKRFAHEFSGGQRQRIVIARALAVEPSFIVCDEPISALDVSIQAQIVNMLEDLQHERGLTYLFIAHDLAMVKHISHRIAVMYMGKIVELADSRELYANPQHPYTKALLSAIPIPDPDIESQRERIMLEGDVPSPINPPPGCRFRTRCPNAMKVCGEEEPPTFESGNHMVACHLLT
ncbi:MAG: ATP-binding cassette domain-containing protein [Firmicutes bacterium]|nr:ATP-binding cassette domain-containing protein [Bacillota bacterium]